VAEIDFVILADYVRGEPSTGVCHIMGGGIDRVMAPVVPTAQNVGLAMRILFTRNECGRDHPVEIIFQTEDGQRLAEVSFKINPSVPPDLLPGMKVGALVNANMGLPLPTTACTPSRSWSAVRAARRCRWRSSPRRWPWGRVRRDDRWRLAITRSSGSASVASPGRTWSRRWQDPDGANLGPLAPFGCTGTARLVGSLRCV
jgi:hypothetical protein